MGIERAGKRREAAQVIGVEVHGHVLARERVVFEPEALAEARDGLVPQQIAVADDLDIDLDGERHAVAQRIERAR